MVFYLLKKIGHGVKSTCIRGVTCNLYIVFLDGPHAPRSRTKEEGFFVS